MDTTLVQPVSDVLAVFGVPVMWLVTTSATVVLIINTIKALIPNWVQSNWYPVIGAVISLGYAVMTLRPDWIAVVAGSIGLFVTQWGTWFAAKRTAIAMKARPE